MKTVRLTAAQACVRYLANQFVEVDGQEVPYFAGVWAIFGHGNVAGVAQIGNGSRAVTDQDGVNNTSGIIQIGNGQDVEVRQRGEGNISVVVQSGYN